MIWAAAAYAVFLWWFSTGAILYVVSRAEREGRDGYVGAVVLAIPVLMLGCIGVAMSLADTGLKGAFMGFTCALLIWGWFEMAFLAGIITGPNTYPTPQDTKGWERFIRAWGAIAYSEMALVCTAILMTLLSLGAANQIALWTFLVLFFARIFAKLNLYFGVPNINDEFLPGPVRHLTTHFRRAPMNTFFPISVTAVTLALAAWIALAIVSPAGGGAQIGFVLLAALTALALFEHWMMILPLPDAALWRWMLPSPKAERYDTKTAAPAAQPEGLR
ncbi:MAG: putative photosynthetic complex assembly protein PuhE [Pseudomonadota bacterium]